MPKRSIIFPPVTSADSESGLVAMGGDLEVDTLLTAYKSGIFPWPVTEPDIPLLWFAPKKRAVLFFKDLKIPTRLKRELKNCDFKFELNRDFSSVIQECKKGETRKNQPGTWITDEMEKAYLDFHKAGHATSFETYNAEGKLVGGLYGVAIKSFFAGESMFYKEKGASKFALISGVEYLKNRGVTWMDIQVMSPLLKQLGAKEITRQAYMKLLEEALS